MATARAIVCGVKLTDEALAPGEGGGNEPVNPEPDPEPTPGDTITIASVLALGQGATINGTIEAVVVSNYELNNLTSKKGMYVQDATGALQFYLAANHEFAFGTKVKIDIKEIQKGCYTVDITAVKGGMNVLPMYLTGKRTQPLYCGKTNESYDYTIVMPSGMHYVGKNMMLSYEKPFGSIQIQIEQKGNVLEIKRKLKITKDMIKPADYEAFRAMMVDWNNSNYTNLMFKKN